MVDGNLSYCKDGRLRKVACRKYVKSGFRCTTCSIKYQDAMEGQRCRGYYVVSVYPRDAEGEKIRIDYGCVIPGSCSVDDPTFPGRCRDCIARVRL